MMTPTPECAGPEINSSPEPTRQTRSPASYGEPMESNHDGVRMTHLTVPGSFAPGAQSLPVELLHNIFLFCGGEHPTDKPHPNRPPLIFGRVCAQWRRIAYSSPKLWTNLNFNLAGPGVLEERISLAEAWVARASPLPLSISYTIPRKLSWNTSAGDLLLLFLNQTVNLTLDLPFRLLHPLVGLPPGSMSLLEVLELRNLEHPLDLPFRQAQPINFSGACRLRSVTMTRLGTRSLQSVRNIPWSQLSYLSLINSTLLVHEAREILTNSPNLVSLLCDFANSGTLGENHHHPPLLIHHNLRHCVISTHGCRISEFFQCLALPELNSLGIIYNGDQVLSDEVVLPALINLRRRSLFPLTSLAFRKMHLPLQQFIQILRHISEISELHLDECCCLDHDLIHHLHFNPLDSPPLLPALRRLYILDSSHALDDSEIIAMIESRRLHPNHPPSQLTDVAISLGDIQTPSSNARLDQLRLDGLQIEGSRPAHNRDREPALATMSRHTPDDFHRLWDASLDSQTLDS